MDAFNIHSNTKDVSLAAVGSAPNANGATVTSPQVLNLEPASATMPGVVTAGAQTFGGAKTFASVITDEAKPTTPASGTGITIDASGVAKKGLLKVTAALTAWGVEAAQTADITLAVIPAKMKIKSVHADTTTKYAGLAGTIAMTVGIAAGGAQCLKSKDVKTAAVTNGLLSGDIGTELAAGLAIQNGYIPSWSAATTISARLTSGTGNIGDGAATNLTTGVTTFYIELEAL